MDRIERRLIHILLRARMLQHFSESMYRTLFLGTFGKRRLNPLALADIVLNPYSVSKRPLAVMNTRRSHNSPKTDPFLRTNRFSSV